MRNKINNTFIDRYMNGESAKDLCKEFNICYSIDVINYLKNLNLPLNYHSRKYQKYECKDDYCIIYLKHKGKLIPSYIDKEDYEKCKNFGIWSINKNNYVVNYKTGIYLHRFLMDTIDNKIEIDHKDGNPLNNRKDNLRYATSSQQKINTKIRKDNKSGIRGVYYDTDRCTWNVSISINKKRIAKRFNNKEDAINFSKSIYNKYVKDFIRLE